MLKENDIVELHAVGEAVSKAIVAAEKLVCGKFAKFK